MTRLLVATTNAGKQLEFRRLLAHLPAELVTPDEIGLVLEVEEPYRPTPRMRSQRPMRTLAPPG